MLAANASAPFEYLQSIPLFGTPSDHWDGKKPSDMLTLREQARPWFRLDSWR
jgi:hypothetical protein